MKVTYDEAFYGSMKEPNLASARVIAPLVIKLVRPRSVIDIGCGQGLWLKAFTENGVEDVYGVDGEWVNPKDVVISKDRFAHRRFDNVFTLDRTADLVMSLEVAEHIAAIHADHFIDVLTSVAPVVFFSAAIPHQGGAHHVNEQWPQYWVEKFHRRGYVAIDALRHRVWTNLRVAPFYAQNILIFVKETELYRYPELETIYAHGAGAVLPYVHPAIFTSVAEDAARWKIIVPYIGLFPVSFLRRAKKMLISIGRPTSSS